MSSIVNDMLPISINLKNDFFKEEKRNGFLVDATRKEIWAVELDLLIQFDRICNKLGLQYFLDAGTLLGSIRDNGFIPWDDDIDVAMLRTDYDQLLKYGPKEFKYPYFFQNAYTDDGYFRAHSQLRNTKTCAIMTSELGKVHFNQGIFIDIFVLDGINIDLIHYQNQMRQKYRYYKKIISNTQDKVYIRKVLKICYSKYLNYKYHGISGIFEKIEELYKNNNDTEFVDKVMFRKVDDVVLLKRSWFDTSVDTEFEGYTFPAPIGYDSVLKAYYGDYMTPKETPNYHSEFGEIIFSTQTSYLDYLEHHNSPNKHI